MYIVLMKRVTASDARKNWFRLLDEVAAGEVVSIDRAGRRILIQRAPAEGEQADIPDYSSILVAESPGQAEAWGWEWPGPEGELRPSTKEGVDSLPEDADAGP
jgi:antitoxin (DNA-binding transcriptional repressor) of toxin-antitoxin stability system